MFVGEEANERAPINIIKTQNNKYNLQNLSFAKTVSKKASVKSAVNILVYNYTCL